MSKRKWLGVFLAWLFVDLGCLAMAHPRSWLYGFGVRGLIVDFVLGIIVLGLYIRNGEQS